MTHDNVVSDPVITSLLPAATTEIVGVTTKKYKCEALELQITYQNLYSQLSANCRDSEASKFVNVVVKNKSVVGGGMRSCLLDLV